MKLHFCIGGLLGCLAGAARGGFVPILLTPASYNQDMVVEAGAPAPLVPGGYTTASMDQGTGNANFSWYEQGYNTAAPTTGLPKAGTTFTHQSLSDHHYQMAPSYRSNNAVVLDATHANATLTLVTPAAWTRLSLLESGGHNGIAFTYQVRHQNGDVESGSGSIPDWYNGASAAWTANGRVDVGTFALDSVNGNNPRLYAIDLTLVDTTNPVTRIDFSYSSGTGHGVIMAVSGSTGGAFVPIAVGGYNQDVVVEADGPHPGGLAGATTATMEDGTRNTQATWYETGYVRNAPGSGLPPAGGTFTNATAPDHVYAMAPSYRTNNAVFLGPGAKTATITPAAPAAFPALSFLAAVGNGPLTIGCAVRHASGAVENSTLVVPDWFGGTPVAWVANGRVAVSAKAVSSVNSGQPRLYSLDLPLANTTSPVTGITLTWQTGGASTFASVLAVSGGSMVLPLAGDDWNANTEAAALMLQEWYNSSGLWDTTGWWNAANCLEALENTALQDNGRFYLGVLTNTYNLNSGGGFLNSYYDDEGWWANAWIRAYDLTGNPVFLDAAKSIFSDLVGGWDSTNAACPGGLFWNKSRTYKNAIPNELFLLAAIRLHQRTPGDTGIGSFYYWATNEWSWFKASGMINSGDLINDGLNGCANNGGTTWTYNQGVILGGLVNLYKVTGTPGYLTEATAIATAAINSLVDANGVLVEPCESGGCGGDGPQFKGIFVHYLADLYDLTRNPAFYSFLYKNAHGVWFKDRNQFNQLGLHWDGPPDSEDAARQSSAMMAVSALAEPATLALPFARGAGDPSFSHAIGAAAGTLGWGANSTTTSPGFLQYGPYVTYLPPGPHAAHFQLSVGAASTAPAALAQIDVRENNGGTSLATAAVPWSAFPAAKQGCDFLLLFTNLTAANPLEFRVYWNAVAGAPSFFINDVTIDGLRDWSGAGLTHDVGQLDGLNAWEADPRRNTASGYLARGPGAGGIAAGDYEAGFELKVDNFNWDTATVATISVEDVDEGLVVASENLARNAFPNVLYQTFPLPFNAVAGHHYDFRVYWFTGPNAPRLTLRSVQLRPGARPFFTGAGLSGGQPVLSLVGTPGQTYGILASPSLVQPVWSRIGAVTVPSFLGAAQFIDPAPGTKRFYRVVAP